jgi:hypothetical protein
MKKGSMELGVNAIVILIIALAILGLGIAFVTNLFGSGSDKLGDIISNAELPVHADPGQPVKFETNEMNIKKGKRDNIKVSVYNNGFASDNEEISLALTSCKDSSNNEANGISIAAPGQRISPGSDSGYIVVFTVDGNSEPDTYICTVEASGGSGSVSGQLIIEVTL